MPFTNSVPNPYAIVSNQLFTGSAGGAVGGILFPSSVGKLPFYIQVIGSGGPLYVNYSNVIPSTGGFNIALKPASSTFAGDGGVLLETAYPGPVAVSGGIDCRFVAWQGGRVA